jgi:DNA replication protein DnaC
MKRLEDVLRQALDAEPSADPTSAWSSDTNEAEPGAITCARCRGAGFVQRNVPIGHPDFGRAVPCVCTDNESEAERLARLQRYSNLGALKRHTFVELMRSGGQGSAQQARFERALEIARRFAAAPEGWLVLLGESGSGKTRIAAAIANAVIAAGRPALFLVVPDLLDHLRAAFAPEAEAAYDRLFEQVRGAPLVILDDLGVQSPTPWAEEKIYQLINHRFNLALPTVFTIAGRFDALPERLRTRLADPGLVRTLLIENARPTIAADEDPLALPLISEMTFQSFNFRPSGPDLPEQVARKLQHAFNAARNFALNPDGWLVLAGETGCGKTHLAAAVAHQQRAAGRPCLFVTVPDLLDKLRGEAFAERSRDGIDSLDRVSGAPFLVLDDLGVHSDTAWAQEKLYQILNRRYMGKLPTVITIRPSDELPAALRSRLYDDKVSHFVEIDAPDYRNPDGPRTAPTRRTRGARDKF